ncbi:hypothetical protein [Streptomyces phage phiScoe44]|nr:hypothetical protein [Streptomyces phage phiScoe44]
MSASTDPFSDVKRLASVLGDLRGELIKEGFSEEEAFDLIVLMISQGAIQ